MSKVTDFNTRDMPRWKEADTRSCRNCEYFIRVDETRLTNKYRGFCIRGENEGNYGLYLSSSYAQSCPSFLQNKTKHEVTTLEDMLADMLIKFRNKYERKNRALMKLAKGKISWHEFGELNAAAWQEFVWDNYEMLKELAKYNELTLKEYNLVIDSLQLSLSDYVKEKIAKKSAPAVAEFFELAKP